MSKESLEHLSSLMDGELSRETGLFLTRRLTSDEVMCNTWERYHLIRDCIRQPGSKQVVTGLCMELIDKEKSHSHSSWRQVHWLKPVSGLAIAASVALMAIVVSAPQHGLVPDTVGETALSSPVNQPFVSPNTLPVSPVSQAASYSASQQNNSNNQLNAYLLRHNQMARTAGRQGFVSFVPIVASTEVASTKIATADTAESDSESVKSNTEQDVTENR